MTPVRELVHTITADNGKGFAMHKQISNALDTDVYFAHPYHAWERGLNENTNGLIRQYFPKGSPLEHLTQKQIQKVQDRLNHRPRKCLNFKTPYYVFKQAFCQLAGASIPEPTDGISMLPALLGQDTQQPHEYLYWERLGVSAVRMGNWKAYVPEGHTNPDGAIELYDLSVDIGEQNDIAADHPDIVSKTRTIVQESHEDTPWEAWEYDGPIPNEYGTVVL